MLVASLAPDIDRLWEIATGCCEDEEIITESPLSGCRSGDFCFDGNFGSTSVGEVGGDEPEPEPNEVWRGDPGVSAMRSDIEPGMAGKTLLVVENLLFVRGDVDRAGGIGGVGRESENWESQWEFTVRVRSGEDTRFLRIARDISFSFCLKFVMVSTRRSSRDLTWLFNVSFSSFSSLVVLCESAKAARSASVCASCFSFKDWI